MPKQEIEPKPLDVDETLSKPSKANRVQYPLPEEHFLGLGAEYERLLSELRKNWPSQDTSTSEVNEEKQQKTLLLSPGAQK